MPRKESYPIPLKYIDVISATFADLEIAQENEFMTIGMSTRTEICQIQEPISTTFTLLNETLLKGCDEFGRILTKIMGSGRDVV